MSALSALITKIAKTDYATLVVEVEILAWSQQRPRLIRLRIMDGSYLDIRVTGRGDYSYHWEHRMIDGGLHRWDNAPHHGQVATHPHHLHDGSETTVVESELPTSSPEEDIRYVLSYIFELISSNARHL